MNIRKIITDFQQEHGLSDAEARDLLADFIKGAALAEVRSKGLGGYLMSFLDDRRTVLTGDIPTEGKISTALRHHAEGRLYAGAEWRGAGRRFVQPCALRPAPSGRGRTQGRR